ncbi:hypothetical protein ACVIQS_001476 [Bradyrhizobium diazoefficiens]
MKIETRDDGGQGQQHRARDRDAQNPHQAAVARRAGKLRRKRGVVGGILGRIHLGS